MPLIQSLSRAAAVFLILGAPFVPSAVFAEANPIKVGATLSLSGKLAFVGLAQQQGLELAIEDINRSGGIQGRAMQLITEDNAGDPKTAVSGVNKLLEMDSVDVLFSSFSHITLAIKDRVKRSGKIMIYAASMGEVAKENPHFFRDWGDAESQGATLAQAVFRGGFKNAAFLTETSEGCLSIQNSFNQTAIKLGVAVVATESYAPGETDFKPILLRLAQKKPQAIATCTWRDAALIMPQLKSLGMIGIPTFQYLAPFLPASDSPEVRKLYEENGTVAVWVGFIEGSLTPEQKAFFDRMQTKFGASSTMESALAYDDMIVLAAALKDCPSQIGVEADCVSHALQSSASHGIAGPLNFDEFRRSSRPDLLIQVKAGKWETASEAEGRK